MKYTFGFASLPLLLALVFTGCTSPSPTTHATSPDPDAPMAHRRLPTAMPPVRGEPVDLDFEAHLHYGNIEVETLESGTKRISLRSEDDATLHQSGIFWRLPEPLQPGDGFTLVLTAESVEGGPVSFPVMVESGEAPWTKEAMETLSFGDIPLTLEVRGTVGEESIHESTHINLHLGQLTGVPEIHGVRLLRESASP